MPVQLRDFYLAGLLALLVGPAAALVGPAAAESSAPFPARPLHFIVPFPPGGTLDVLARTLSMSLARRSARPSWWRTVRAHPASSGRNWLRVRRPMATRS
jgi:tripartite-type tricarboxylate transporter receptor subunit TctC